ncbi:ABC transporter permease [Sulfobacillus thermosulfidooxidans]|uniref:ABC transporter permease n=1 Tax=Sulfobacillus thermosulfidooxidans TaxID=28034 RepID=UPI00040E9965|nr:ABC transporter permease [Sulfobacillus thermosulfidooxidans]OLZ10221.1 hypothetical protein BFX05_10590 [Sulfobacillus thermosulfidooxidans]OLZ17013.1 hypothetical protein BFX06_13800 [Sulfobacillus thermosulfidooxidans]OLZ20109.1 hypothetical protein BFX07_00530 [Sulfobacillus thermosulfidooxidans]
MAQFFIRRFLLLIPVMFGVTILIFLALHLAPGNPAQLLLGPMATPSQLHAITVQLGLNQPWPIQYVKWLGNLLRGNMGQSIQLHEAVTPLVFSKLDNTLILASVSFLVASIVGITIGVLAGLKEDTWIDVLANVVGFIGLSVPVFWLGLVAILIFGLKLRWFPITGMYELGAQATLGQLVSHVILPASTLAVAPGAVIAQLTRVAIIEERHQLYVRTAIAKGLSVNKAAVRHALRNAWIPIVTTLGLEVNYLIGGDVLVENIFNWPGIGQLLVQSVLARDYPTILGSSVVLSIIFVLVNFVIDALYPLIDPRVKANG